VDVEIGVAVRLTDFGRIDVRQPVIGDDFAGNVEDQSAERIYVESVVMCSESYFPGKSPRTGIVH
jgi:hypothetical protein